MRLLHLVPGLVPGLVLLSACARPVQVGSPPAAVRPGISVLMTDSIGLIRNKRIGLITNQTGIDEHGVSDIDLLRGPVATAAGVRLVRLYSPEHGIRGTEDRENLASGVDEKSGLMIVSLYENSTTPPPDSTLRDIDAIVVDLQDIGTRTWTYVGVMFYTLQSAARLNLRVIVLDRPNPITGNHTDGPYLDSALANPYPPQPGRPGRAFALYPVPLRHGMTMGEMALFINEAMKLNANLRVVPAAGWKRAMWFDETGLPWVRPSPNLPNLTSATIYPSLVPFESSNVSVGRGTTTAFQRFGAPWMNAPEVARRLEALRLPGTRFVVDSFMPREAGDRKYNDQLIPGVRIMLADRNAFEAGTVAAAILSVLRATSPDSLRITPRGFDERFGSPRLREAIMRGEDPMPLMARERAEARAFAERMRRFWLYQ
ncbi:MAG TPA: DUF1343 domain-containing protein [Gemmatimonadaceae bacterium]|nr:DUF1343 domain-containing protein [Gemmatimonadaceae bacterium]